MTMKIATMAALCGGFLLSQGAMRAADTKPAGSQKPQASAAQSKSTAVPLSVPAGAVAISPGTYSFTDTDGKKWIFRQTPFGVAKFEDRERPASDEESEQKRIAQTTAAEDGDSIRFERPGPFGMYRWKVKKTELSSMEQAVWDRVRGQQPSAREKE